MTHFWLKRSQYDCIITCKQVWDAKQTNWLQQVSRVGVELHVYAKTQIQIIRKMLNIGTNNQSTLSYFCCANGGIKYHEHPWRLPAKSVRFLESRDNFWCDGGAGVILRRLSLSLPEFIVRWKVLERTNWTNIGILSGTNCPILTQSTLPLPPSAHLCVWARCGWAFFCAYQHILHLQRTHAGPDGGGGGLIMWVYVQCRACVCGCEWLWVW